MRKFTLTVIGPYKLSGPGVLVILGPTDGWPDVIVVGFLGLVDPSVWTRQLAVHYHPAHKVSGQLWEQSKRKCKRRIQAGFRVHVFGGLPRLPMVSSNSPAAASSSSPRPHRGHAFTGG